MLSLDSAAGNCCLSGSTNNCLLDQFYCSNKVSTSFAYHKYNFCSFNSTICGNPQRNLRSKMTTQTVSTGVEFSSIDVCPYILLSDTDLPFNTNIQLNIDQAINSNVFVLTGSSLDTVNTQQQLTTGSSITIDSGTITFIIIIGTYTGSYAQFSFKNVEIISDAGWMGIIIGASFGYFLLLVTAIIIITKKLTTRRLRELQSPNIVYFLKKKVIQYMRAPRQATNQGQKTQEYAKIPQLGLKDYFSKMNEGDQVKQAEMLNIFDNNSDPQARINTEIERIPSSRTQAPPTAATLPPIQKNQVDKPKVTIRPYKFDFDCYTCLSSTATTNKFCIPYEDAATGYCCDTLSSTDQCATSGRYLCTDSVQSKSMKLYLCPNLQTKCFSTSNTQDFDQNTFTKVIQAGDESQQVGGTTLEFGQNDICGWRIIADTQYTNNKFIRIQIASIYQANCYINSGDSIKSTSNEISCVAGTQYDFDADKNVFIIVQGQVTGSEMQFTYQLIDRISFTQISIIYSVSVAVFVILASIVAMLTVRFVVQITVRKSQLNWQSMTVEMRQIVDNANKQLEIQKAGQGDEIDNIFVGTNVPGSRNISRMPSQPGAHFAQVKPWNEPPIQNYAGNSKNVQPQFNLY